MTEFDDALLNALSGLPNYLKWRVEETGYFDMDDEIYLRVNADESCSIQVALWTPETFDNLDEFIQFMEDGGHAKRT